MSASSSVENNKLMLENLGKIKQMVIDMRDEEKDEEKKTKLSAKIQEIQTRIEQIKRDLANPYVDVTLSKTFTPPAGYDPAAMKKALTGQLGGRKRKSKKGRAKITKRRKSRSNQKKSKRHFR